MASPLAAGSPMTLPTVSMFARSLAFVDDWIAELKPKPAPKPVPAATEPKKTEKKEKKQKGPASPASPAADDATSMSKVSLKVGKVVEVKPHPESAKLYIEQIDMGNGDVRTVLSGLQEHVKLEEFLGRLVVVAANLDPRKIAGIPSHGMVLCASTADKGAVKLLDVPEGVPLGERVLLKGHEAEPEPVLKKKLSKHWDAVAPELKTDASGTCVYQDVPFMTSMGPVTCKAVLNGSIS